MIKIKKLFSFRKDSMLSYVMVLILGSALSLSASAQGTATESITGTVIDANNNETLPYATVVIMGTTIGAVTDFNGVYEILHPPLGDHKLKCTFVGYKAQIVDIKVEAGSKLKMDFSLANDYFNMEVVIVTGVASKSSKAVAEIAIQRIDAEELASRADYKSVDAMLSGKIAGVSMTQAAGYFGAATRLNMRSGGGLNGDGQPVYYVDGIKIGSSNVRGGGNIGISPISHINPNDIKSIEVIKGPAGAGSYGTGGSNGVILITTKRGDFSAAKKWTVGYRGTFGVNQADRQYGEKEFRNYEAMNDYFQSGLSKKHQVYVTGGTEDVRVYFSLDNSDEEGHTPQNSMKQLNLRANFDYLPSPKFKLSVSTAYNQTDLTMPQAGRGDGEFGYLTFVRHPYDNTVPGWWRTKESFELSHDLNDINSFVGSATAEFKPWALQPEDWKSGFSARATFGVDDKNSIRTDFGSPLVYDLHGDESPGYKSINRFNGRVLTVNADIAYEYNIGKVKTKSIIGVQAFEESQNSLFAAKSEYPSNLFQSIGGGDVYDEIGESNNHFKSLGVFTEHSFNYDDFVMGSFMIRRDIASVMGTDVNSIIYPRASAAIRLDRFDWVPDNFSLFKFRVAYGETGILPRRTWGIPTLWGPTNSQYGVGVMLRGIGNPALTPERVKEFEIGFDTEFKNFALDVTYYRQNASGSIIPQSNITSSGIVAAAPMMNVGKVEGSGIEAQLQGVFSGAAMKGWSAGFSLIGAFQTNKVIDLNGEIIMAGAGGGRQVYMEGEEKNAFYNPVITGAIFATAADVTNGVLVDEELSPRAGELALLGEIIGVEDSGGPIINGSGIPKFIGSLSMNFSAYGFTFNAMFQAKTGHVLYNEARVDQMWAAIDEGGYYHGDPNAEWVGFNEGAGTQSYLFDELSQSIGYGDFNIDPSVVPVGGYEIGSQEYIDAANEWARTTPYYDANCIQKGDYIKLKEISLSYDATKFLQKSKLKDVVDGFSIGIVATNIWKKFHKSFTGIDPEINSLGYGASPQNMMQAGNIAPPRTISLFINVRF